MADSDTRAEAIEQAALLDQQGRHTEALDLLARAAGAGDGTALARLGIRLLTGRHAPLRPMDGVGLLGEASNKGSAEACAVLSVLAGGGFYGPQNWSAALDYLARAAELGWAEARAQLRLLTGSPTRTDWAALRRSIELDAWTGAPPVKVLRERPRLLTVRGLVPHRVCDWVIERCRDRLVRAEVNDPRTGLPVMGATRTNRLATFTLTETSLVNLLIQARIAAAAGVPMATMEAFSVLNYAVGEEASEHVDYLDPANPAYAAEIARLGQRIATCLLYLNDDYEGGATDFPELGLSHRGGKGDALIFFGADAAGTPDPRTLHAGRPPTAGEKWVLSQFIRNRTGIRPGS